MSHMVSLVKQYKWAIPVLALGLVLGCEVNQETSRTTGSSTLVLEMPVELGSTQRPSVEFDHGRHATALEEEGCETCHASNEDGTLEFSLLGTDEYEGMGDLMDAYHNQCIGCHSERDEPEVPNACADCHVERPVGISARIPMGFDYSLHGRHSEAYRTDVVDTGAPEMGQEGRGCDSCHHVYDEQSQELVYREGEESGCGGGDCHGDRDEGRNLSLANASHQSCVNCHMERSGEGLDTGPTACVGCHDQAEMAQIERLPEAEIPRIERNQPDTTWIHTEGGQLQLVAFDHRGHEGLTDSCSTCHHETMNACGDCHTPGGVEEGGGVTLQMAYHDDQAEQSCVGCHETVISQSDCAGCHVQINETPRERSCALCHNGPLPGDPAAEYPPSLLTAAVLDPLPETSEDAFPDTIMIGDLSDQYGPSEFPHQQIVQALYDDIGESSLARQFHGSTEMLCSGCHHQTPLGSRPPSCSTCHTESGEPTEDVPSLTAAYHRQCVGCHQEMDQPQGCTDCHEEAATEVNQ